MLKDIEIIDLHQNYNNKLECNIFSIIIPKKPFGNISVNQICECRYGYRSVIARVVYSNIYDNIELIPLPIIMLDSGVLKRYQFKDQLKEYYPEYRHGWQLLIFQRITDSNNKD